MKVEAVGRRKRPHGSSTIGDAPKKSKRGTAAANTPEKSRDHHKKRPSSSSSSSLDKKAKLKTADLVVKALVPHFKAGMIASKEVFKFTAREVTHTLLLREKSRGESVRDLDAYSAALFDWMGIILSEDDAKKKIADFDASFAR